MNQNLSEAAMNYKMESKTHIYSHTHTVTHSNEEVNHEEDVEGEVNLLGGVLHPRDAGLYTVTAMNTISTFGH